jgi:hypothetical protein
MTLDQKVRAIVMQDDDGEGPTSVVSQRPGWHGFEATDFESNLRDWGCVFGIAFGLARSEEPCEPVESVARRAYEAAWPVFVTYTGGFQMTPEQGKAIEGLRRQYRAARGRDLPPDLERAIIDVLDSRQAAEVVG